MIYNFTRDLLTNLQAYHYPVTVEYEPQRTGVLPSYGIVVRRDTQGGDAVDPAQGTVQAPRKCASRRIGVVLQCYVQSPLDGALPQDHHALCDQLVDAVQSIITQWATAARAAPVQFSESRYLAPADLDDGDVYYGAVYQMRFTLSRGVFLKDFEGISPLRATIARTENTTLASYVGGTTSEVA